MRIRHLHVAVAGLALALALAGCGTSGSTFSGGSASAGTVSPAATGSGSPQPSRTPSTAASRTATGLGALLPAGMRSFRVTVPGGFDAIAWDEVGHLRFYHLAIGGSWRQVGAVDYRHVPGEPGEPVKVAGQVLDGQRHATFVLHGVFTGDGSGDAMAYTRGKDGWGVVTRHGPHEGKDGTRLFVRHPLPAITSDQQVVYENLGFSNGFLVETGCFADVTVARCGAKGTTYTTWWHWSDAGQDFRNAQ